MKDVNDLSNSSYLDESITEDYSNIDWKDPFKGLRENIKDAGKNIKDTTKDIGKNIKDTTKDIVKNDNLKKGLKGTFLTYNPAIAIPRSSALLAFRVNLFGISSRLYPAFLSESALKKGNFDLENAKKAKIAWEKVSNFWEDKIGGDSKKLREAISGAWNKPVFKTKKSEARKKSTSGFDGYDTRLGDVSVFYEDENYYNYEPATMATSAYISTGITLVTTLLSSISKQGASKNPYVKGSKEYNEFEKQLKEGDVPPAALNQSELDKALAAAESDRRKGLGLDNTGLDLGQLNEDADSRKSGKILGIPKTAFWIGVTVLGLLGGVIVYTKYIKK
jgi:hypothetical protein